MKGKANSDVNHRYIKIADNTANSKKMKKKKKDALRNSVSVVSQFSFFIQNIAENIST